MFTISAFTHLVDGLVAIHRQRRNVALLNDLPDATRRDIGLPARQQSDSETAWTGRIRR